MSCQKVESRTSISTLEDCPVHDPSTPVPRAAYPMQTADSAFLGQFPATRGLSRVNACGIVHHESNGGSQASKRGSALQPDSLAFSSSSSRYRAVHSVREMRSRPSKGSTVGEVPLAWPITMFGKSSAQWPPKSALMLWWLETVQVTV